MGQLLVDGVQHDHAITRRQGTEVVFAFGRIRDPVSHEHSLLDAFDHGETDHSMIRHRHPAVKAAIESPPNGGRADVITSVRSSDLYRGIPGHETGR